MHNSDQKSGFISHIAELRKRLIHSFIFLIIFLLVVIFLPNIFMVFLVEPFAQAVKMMDLKED